MADKLERWMAVYIASRRRKDPVDVAEKNAGVTYADVAMARKGNSAFRNALLMLESGIEAYVITPEDLTRVLEAQTTDERAAGFFAMTTEEFLSTVQADENLKRVYDTARLRGQAMLQRTIYDAALAGDPTMLKFTGQQLLGMNDTAKVEITHKRDMDDQEVYRQLSSMMQAAKLRGKVVDAEAREVDTVESIQGD